MSTSADSTPTGSGKKFLFETKFDRSDVPRVVAEPKISVLQSEIDAAKAEAYNAGVQAGKLEEANSQQVQMNAMLGKVAEAVRAVGADADARQKANDEALATAVKAITQKLLPRYAEMHGMAEIEGLVQSTLVDLRAEPRLVVRVADQHLDACMTRLPALAKQTGFTGDIIIMGDANLRASDCRIEWADGGLERLENNLWTEIERVLGKYGPKAGALNATNTVTSSEGAIDV